MKEVVAVIRMNMMNQTKKALTECGIPSFYAHEAQGRGKGFASREVLEGAEQGYEEAAALLGEKGKLYPKRIVTVVVEDSQVGCVIETIINTNQTGLPGDGKVFILPLEDSVRLRTGEVGSKAIS